MALSLAVHQVIVEGTVPVQLPDSAETGHGMPYEAGDIGCMTSKCAHDM
ncbi:hypothetical protein [Vineibacter terrae]|nr:hypothetical protein [Vineibacter terrae]HEX2890268.1 hypothetical protein [Vineibacter terrae]